MSSHLVFCLDALFSDESFDMGSVTRTGVKDSKYSVDVRRLMKALLNYSWDPEHFANKIIGVLAQCTSISSMVNDLINGVVVDSNGWVANLKIQCKHPEQDLGPLCDLAKQYFTHLLVPFRNPSGKKTPQVTVDPTPDTVRDDEIQELISQATVKRSQGALTRLVFKRDGYLCPVSAYALQGDESIGGQCSHILPFSIHEKTQTHDAIELFTHKTISRDFILASTNHPRNAMNSELQLHKAFDDLIWGIEATAQSDGKTYQYKYRVVNVKGHSPLSRLFNIHDGLILSFGKSSKLIDLPDPNFCNLKLAVARVMHASGAAEAINAYERDYEEMEYLHAVHLGSNEVSDDLFMEALFMRTTQLVTV